MASVTAGARGGAKWLPGPCLPPAAQPSMDIAETVPVATGPSPVEAAVSTETAHLVSTAVAQLPAQQRMVVVLRNWNGLSFGEIAEIAGLGEGTIRSHMHHALAGIRRYLEPRMTSEEI